MKFLETNTTGELGVIEVNKIVRLNNSIFHIIQRENDIGVDALIEFVIDEKPINKMVAVQIKTGDSYFYDNGDSKIPIDGHYNYWSNYTLPVYGITCRVSRETGQAEAYWVDISTFLRKHREEIETGKLNIIRFPSNDLSKFDIHTFRKIFIPNVLNEVPEIAYDEALKLFNSKNQEEQVIGLRVLFKRYTHKFEVWDFFIEYFIKGNIRTIPEYLVYILSHIPWHGDLSEKGTITEEAREYAREKIKKFSKEEVIKLLGFIEETDISRGTIGQCVEAVISLIDKKDSFLESIILDNKLSIELREGAALIYAYYYEEKSLDVLTKFDESDSINDIIYFIQENGYFNLY